MKEIKLSILIVAVVIVLIYGMKRAVKYLDAITRINDDCTCLVPEMDDMHPYCINCGGDLK